MRSLRGARGRRGGVAAAVVAVLFVSGCAGPPPKQEGPTNLLPSPAEYFDAPCPEAPVKRTGEYLTYWSMWRENEPEGKVLRRAVDCFTRQSGVTVDVHWLGRRMLTESLLPALNTDEVPDLVDFDLNTTNAEIVARGGVQDLQDVLSMKVGEGDETVRDVLPAHSYAMPQNLDDKGKPFLIPYETLGDAWWYDRGSRQSPAPPRTVDEMFALFDKAQHGGKAAITQSGEPGSARARFFTQLAARYVGTDRLAAAAKDASGLSWRADPGFLKAAQVIERLADGDYLASGWERSSVAQSDQRFADGEAGYTFGPSSLPSKTHEYLDRQRGKDAELGSFQFPTPQGATHDVVEQLPVGFSLLSNAKNPEAAKAFIAYTLNKDILKGISAVTGNVPPRPDLPVPGDLREIKAALDDPRKDHTLPAAGIAGDYLSAVLYPTEDALLKGELTASEFIRRLAARSAEHFKARR